LRFSQGCILDCYGGGFGCYKSIEGHGVTSQNFFISFEGKLISGRLIWYQFFDQLRKNIINLYLQEINVKNNDVCRIGEGYIYKIFALI
jgi:hypothetical protein